MNENLTEEQRAQLPKDAPELLTVDDMVGYQNLIDIAVRRGAFQASELSAIGKLYDKLKAFNAYIVKQAKEANEVPADITE